MVQDMGIKAIVYLDDWLVYGPSEEQCREHGIIVKDVLEKLGLIINDRKSLLHPTQEMVARCSLEYQVGLHFNVKFLFLLTLNKYSVCHILVRNLCYLCHSQDSWRTTASCEGDCHPVSGKSDVDKLRDSISEGLADTPGPYGFCSPSFDGGYIQKESE